MRMGTRAANEARVDRLIHLFAIALAAGALAIVLPISAVYTTLEGFTGAALFGFGLLAMLICSTLYNGADASAVRRKDWLRRLDHGAIYLLIAGTYSGFLTGVLDDITIFSVFVAVWVVALLGFTGTLLWPRLMRRFSIGLYLAMGWSVLLAAEPLRDRLSPLVLGLIAAGGLLYSIGVIFYLIDRLPYRRAVWHGFVVAAASCHFVAVVSNMTIV